MPGSLSWRSAIEVSLPRSGACGSLRSSATFKFFLFEMNIKKSFDDVFTVIGIMIGTSVIGASVSIVVLPASLTVSSNCTAGDFEISAMWYTIILALWCIYNAVFFALYGKRDITERAPPTKFLCLMVVFAYSFSMLAIIATSATIFFLLEVRYKKFNCMPHAFKYTLPSILINVFIGCCVIIHQAWQTLYN